MSREREIGDILDKAQRLHKLRRQDYTVRERDGFTAHAEVLNVLFPQGTDFHESVAEKFVILNYIIGKVVRYALLLDSAGGHEDSAMDICVYGAILAALHPEPNQ